MRERAREEKRASFSRKVKKKKNRIPYPLSARTEQSISEKVRWFSFVLLGMISPKLSSHRKAKKASLGL